MRLLAWAWGKGGCGIDFQAALGAKTATNCINHVAVWGGMIRDDSNLLCLGFHGFFAGKVGQFL